jgi:hypothetical protein
MEELTQSVVPHNYLRLLQVIEWLQKFHTHMLRFFFGFRILSPSMTSIYKSKLSDQWEYAGTTTYINHMDQYCQWHLVSKHNSTHTKMVCHIMTDVGFLRKPLCYKSLALSPPHSLFPYGRYLWGEGFTIVNTSLWWASAILPQLLPFIWTNISATTLSMDFGSGPKRILAIARKIYMSTYVDFLIYDSHESVSSVEFSLCLSTRCDFP